jgi:hypothetical protein
LTSDIPRVSADWLALREPADAAARSVELVELLRDRIAGRGRLVVHDLGSGTGSMGRWLAPQLPVPQHWIMYDRDADLLDRVVIDPVTAETRVRDITRLTREDLDGAGLITGSALLDMLTADEVERVAAACSEAGCPALFTISVVGRVELTPPDPLDAEIVDAFNAHQRRTAGDRVLLGPDAVDATADAFRRRGASVELRASPWRLGATADARCGHPSEGAPPPSRSPETRLDHPSEGAPPPSRSPEMRLMAEWFSDWIGAACEQRPELARPLEAYARRRRSELAAGRLGLVVHHSDLLTGL